MSANPAKAIALEWRRTDQLRPHQHTQLPPLSPLARSALEADVGKRGIVEPLEITADGIVLNGRERLAAAKRLGLEQVPVRIVNPADETEHVILAALQRRHLSASQRAALALELDRYRDLKTTADERRRQNLRQHPRGQNCHLGARPETRSPPGPASPPAPSKTPPPSNNTTRSSSKGSRPASSPPTWPPAKSAAPSATPS